MPVDVTVHLGASSYPVLDAYRRCRKRVSVIRGPLGSGKTTASIDRLLMQMIEQEPNAEGIRPTRWIATRNTYPDLTTTTIKDFMAVFQDLGQLTMGGLEPPTFRAKATLDDATVMQTEVIFLALDREDAIKKIRGSQLTGVWGNELKELVKPVWDMLDLRHGRYPSLADGGVRPTWHGMIGDTNSWDEDHWLWKLAVEATPEEWEFFHQPGGVLKVNGQWVANPDAENLANLPEGYYIRAVAGKSDDWIAVNLANEYGFSIDGKPVHPEFVDSLHCPGVIPYDPTQPIVLGIDYGRTPAAVLWQPVPKFGRWVAIDEFVTEDMSASVFGPELKRFLAQHYPNAKIRGWSDPAGDAKGQATEDTPRLILVAAGIPVKSAPSNVAILRRAALANAFRRLAMDGKPGAMISSKCRKLRKALNGGWCFRRLKVAGEERYTDEPDKGPLSHVGEASEYGLLGEGEGVAALRPADYDSRAPMQAYADMD